MTGKGLAGSTCSPPPVSPCPCVTSSQEPRGTAPAFPEPSAPPWGVYDGDGKQQELGQHVGWGLWMGTAAPRRTCLGTVRDWGGARKKGWHSLWGRCPASRCLLCTVNVREPPWSRATPSGPHQSQGVSHCTSLTPALSPGTVLPPALRMHGLLLLGCLWLLAAPPASSIFQRPTGTPGREQGLAGGRGAWVRIRAWGAGCGACVGSRACREDQALLFGVGAGGGR